MPERNTNPEIAPTKQPLNVQGNVLSKQFITPKVKPMSINNNETNPLMEEINLNKAPMQAKLPKVSDEEEKQKIIINEITTGSGKVSRNIDPMTTEQNDCLSPLKLVGKKLGSSIENTQKFKINDEASTTAAGLFNSLSKSSISLRKVTGDKKNSKISLKEKDSMNEYNNGEKFLDDNKKETINMNKILYNINEMNKHIENKFNISNNKLRSKIKNNDDITNNKSTTSFSSVSNEWQNCIELLTPKVLIKISNYNNYGRRELEKEPYFVGTMNNEMAAKVKVKDGEFFLRKIEFNCEDVFFISIFISNHLRHYLILKNARHNLYYIKNYCFHTVQELVRFHLEQRIPIKEGVFLCSWIDTFSWQKQHNQVRLIRKIGGGSFSQVFLGTVEGGSFGQTLKVAVKLFSSTNNQLNSKQKCQFISDASIMINLKSKYIIQLICVCIQKEPLMAILEYASKGPLLRRLKTNCVTYEQKHKYSLHIALAIKYLHENFILHRDIAARNVLIGDGDIAKLSDLGFVFYSSNKTKKKKKRISLRWTAPETLKNGDYTFESEAWSYAIFLVEMFNDGEKPYSHIKNWKELVDVVLRDESKMYLYGNKLPEDLNIIFEKCLNLIPINRPNFDSIVKEIKIERKPIKKVIGDWFSNFYNKYFVFSTKNQISHEDALFKRRIEEYIAYDKLDNSKEISVITSY